MPDEIVPPAPERRPTVLVAHGDERVDDWYWLRDRDDPAVLAHLKAENAYADACLAGQAALRQTLYDEMVARIAETDLSVPVRRGPWWYYHRTEEKKSYPIHCRRPAVDDVPPLDPGPAADEQVLLDENELADGLAFFEVANLAVSPDHRWLAYATDTTGGEIFDLTFRRLGGEAGAAPAAAAPDPEAAPTAAEVPETVHDTYYGLAWAADNATVFYTRVDDAMRPFQLWRHRVGTDPATDVKVLEEPDERFTLSVGKTKDGEHVVAVLQSNTTSEIWVVPAGEPTAELRLLDGRRPGVEYGIEHHLDKTTGRGWFTIVTNDDARDFRLVVAPADRPERAHWHEVVPHRPGTRLEDVDVFDDWLVLAERLDGEPCLRVVPLDHPDGPFAGDLLARSRLVPSAEHPAVTWEGPNPEPSSTTLRYEQTSMVTPHTVLDGDLATGRSTVRKRQPVLGGYDPDRYRTYRTWATADDGTRVPVSVVLRADVDGPAPCVLYGYGAYEHSIDPAFSSLRLSLLDRGVVFAVAHVRGGGEMGRGWYDDGKLAAKPHTFSDFLACARHLVDRGTTVPRRLAARGGSAGGLLMGVVVNEAPELFAAVVAEVPFVDCLTTMMDETLPLTVGEWEEWGNPVADADAYATMQSYSPYDNVRAGPHPRILATAGLHDARVGYWEPAKWVAKLRAADPTARVLLRTELVAGHGGPSGRYDAWRDEALVYAFLLDALDVDPA
jgi:oligopeptidase B